MQEQHDRLLRLQQYDDASKKALELADEKAQQDAQHAEAQQTRLVHATKKLCVQQAHEAAVLQQKQQDQVLKLLGSRRQQSELAARRRHTAVCKLERGHQKAWATLQVRPILLACLCTPFGRVGTGQGSQAGRADEARFRHASHTVMGAAGYFVPGLRTGQG